MFEKSALYFKTITQLNFHPLYKKKKEQNLKCADFEKIGRQSYRKTQQKMCRLRKEQPSIISLNTTEDVPYSYKKIGHQIHTELKKLMITVNCFQDYALQPIYKS